MASFATTSIGLLMCDGHSTTSASIVIDIRSSRTSRCTFVIAWLSFATVVIVLPIVGCSFKNARIGLDETKRIGNISKKILEKPVALMKSAGRNTG